MIRGPALPQSRETLWPLIAARLGRIETGLTLVLESLDCSDGALGPVEGLARDAVGGAVLVVLAVEGDELLPARALSAGQFLQRVGDAMARAVPEANFCPGVPPRVLIVGRESAATAIERVSALPIVGLHACTLEPFRLAGRDRFAVRWLVSSGVQPVAPELPVESAQAAPTASLPCPEFVAPPACMGLWDALLSICERIDAAVTIDGDRFSRCISWNGNQLGEVRTVGGALMATDSTGIVCDLRDMRDVNRFGDQLMRAFVRHAELDLGDGLVSESESHSGRSAAAPVAGNDRLVAARQVATEPRVPPRGESLRSSLAAATLSAEEYSALDDPALVAGPVVEGPAATD